MYSLSLFLTGEEIYSSTAERVTRLISCKLLGTGMFHIGPSRVSVVVAVANNFSSTLTMTHWTFLDGKWRSDLHPVLHRVSSIQCPVHRRTLQRKETRWKKTTGGMPSDICTYMCSVFVMEHLLASLIRIHIQASNLYRLNPVPAVFPLTL